MNIRHPRRANTDAGGRNVPYVRSLANRAGHWNRYATHREQHFGRIATHKWQLAHSLRTRASPKRAFPASDGLSGRSFATGAIA
jgi:hypothetical protein